MFFPAFNIGHDRRILLGRVHQLLQFNQIMRLGNLLRQSPVICRFQILALRRQFPGRFQTPVIVPQDAIRVEHLHRPGHGFGILVAGGKDFRQRVVHHPIHRRRRIRHFARLNR